MYKENPKTKGSGIICMIPETGTCPNKCSDCFFQSGRSYLEPLEENLPNIPEEKDISGRILRVNDGNDSNVQREVVIGKSRWYRHKFYNTAIPKELDSFPGPVVLTVNPGQMTDIDYHQLVEIPKNLMFVRFRTNIGNVDLLIDAVKYYTSKEIPVVVTFMAYYKESCDAFKEAYTFKKRTLNSYWVLKPSFWWGIMVNFRDNPLVYSCGKGPDSYSCSRCGNCIREYYNTMERMRQ